MHHLHEEIRVQAPVEHVWAFYCDTSHWQDWMPRGKFSEFSGPVDKVGTTYVGAMKIMRNRTVRDRTLVFHAYGQSGFKPGH